MILFVSDMHFGRGNRAEERASEAALIACLQSYEARIERLYLVGDVFDEYIEYPSLIPKGFVRFQALLAAWTDRGIPVTYLVGNHDPWHRDYFEQELGVRVLADPLVETLVDGAVYLAHGDGLATDDRLYRRLKPWLRHPLPVWLYRTLLPADAGLLLARWVNRRFGHDQIQPGTVEGLRVHARHILTETPATLVVMGHSHHPEVHTWPEGTYLNLGSWCERRTYACLDDEGPKLLCWNAEAAVAVDLAACVK
jgi:UDP-2,3-diacylglucosamine hydrolase